MSISKTWVQGGQVTLHNLRMIQQVMKVTIVSSIMISLLLFGFKSWTDITAEEKRIIGYYFVAQVKLSIPGPKLEKRYQDWYVNDGYTERVRCVDVVNDKHILSLLDRYEKMLTDNAIYSCFFLGGMMFLICSLWYYRGRVLKRKNILKGSSLVDSKELTKIIRKNKKASDIKLAGVPLIKGSETQHILMVGTTGAGKSNAFNHLLPQIRRRNEKAVIVDTTGEFVAKYYNPETDFILNPLDERSQPWNMWAECSNDIQMDELASGMIPQSLNDPFWCESARSLFSETMKKLARDGHKSTRKLLEYSIISPMADVQEFYESTSIAAMMDKSSDKTTASIRMSLSAALRSLFYLEETHCPFSIRDWIKNDQQTGWLFLVSIPEQRETLRPLLTTWLNVAINGLMSCDYNPDRRVWFIVDEKQSLNKIEALPKALAEIRKYGGCIVSGLQNISQIDQLYGNATSRSMVSNYNTKLFFRSPESNTAQWIAKTIGENEVLEHNEGISFGAHQMRDGVSISEQKRQKLIVPYTDFMTLPDLSAFLKLSGEYPVTKLVFIYIDLPRITAAFVEKIKGKDNVLSFPKKPEDEELIENENTFGSGNI